MGFKIISIDEEYFYRIPRLKKMEKTGIKKEVKTYFVIPLGSRQNEVEDSMKMAFQETREASLSPQWIKENECLNILPSKNVVFVFQKFDKDSEVFKKLRSTKSLLCGPMCLRSCLAENKPIPDNKSPVFTTAMRDVIVTASQISLETKADIKEKVGFMGGVYMSNLADPVTHLVTSSVRSEKYEVAAGRGLPIMKVEWVEAMWQESQIRNIKASDLKIVEEFKCPIFYNMFISSSNLTKEEKDNVKKLVTKHGGTFTPTMRQSETTLLIVNEPKGDKYKHARSWALPCVKPSYIYESVERGYAVPSEGHRVEPAVSCSTPTKEDDPANFTYNSDPSISVINMETNKSHIDETQMTSVSQLGSQQRQPLRPSGNQYSQILKTFTIADAKKAGSFVDGCKVYLSGFSGAEGEKLVRILSLGGATVFTELTESVSHVLLGEFLVDDMRAISGLAQKPHVVSLEWLAASVKQRSPAEEEPFYCLETRRVVPEPPSPLSQKGMQLLKPKFDANDTSMMPPPAEPTVNRKLFSEFIKENIKSPAKRHPSPVKQQNQSMNATDSTQDSIVPDLFLDKKFLVVGYNSEGTEELEEAIEACGGTVVAANFKGVADYAVVPIDTPVPNVTAMEVVTSLWVNDCVDSKEVLELQYYHQPFSVDPDKQPLAECCLSLSSYVGQEKTFLILLAQAMGAKYQDLLVKVAKKKDDVELLPTTHLVCPKPEGKKYIAAAKWGLTAVTKEWLLACSRSNARVPEKNFIVSEDGGSSVNTAQVRSKQEVVTPVVKTTPVQQGMKTADSGFETPVPSTSFKRDSNAIQTPNNPVVTPAREPLSTAAHTPTFPHPKVNSLKRKSSAMTPDDQSPFHMSTPDTPYGQAIATPTAETKKRWKRFIEDFPSRPKSPPSPKSTRRQSTPLSELKRRAFAKALETSEENLNPNYSIEEMEEEPDSVPNPPAATPSPLRREAETPKSIYAHGNKGEGSKLSAQKNVGSGLKAKNSEINTSQRAVAGWSTPSASDFNGTNGTPSSSKKPNAETTPPEKRSIENEMVCKMLGELKQRLSNTPNTSAEEKRARPTYKQLANQPSTSSNSKPVANTILDPESQPIYIGWEDPVETAERARMMSTTSPSSSKPRKFVLSNVNDKEAEEERLQGLGETVCTGTDFDLDTTHLIVDKPVRSEKLLCCLASGRWVLHTSFIDRMAVCGKYVPDEEKFEWGNPESRGQLPSLPARDLGRELARAAYRWRKHVDETSEGAFKGMKAMLFTTPAKSGSYQRLISAGGGIVLPSILSSVKSATHCFMEVNKVPNLTVPLSEFVAHKVPCLPPVFLGEMLTNPSPNVQDSLIPEYKNLLKNK